MVTPFVGVWIETFFYRYLYMRHGVTPFVGVWIETDDKLYIGMVNMGHTLRGCVD